MGLVAWGVVVLIVLFLVLRSKKNTKNSSYSAFEKTRISSDPAFDAIRGVMLECVESVSGAKNPSTAVLFATLLDGAAEALVAELPHAISSFNGKTLTEQQTFFLKFESLIYLYFWSDVSAFSHKQSQKTRTMLREILEQGILERDFYIVDESLEDVVLSRLQDYMGSYSKGGPMNNPQMWFLNHLKVLADTKKVNRSIALPMYGMFEQAVDFGMVATNLSGYTLFATGLKELFGAGKDFMAIDFATASDLICNGLREATPMALSPSDKTKILAQV